MRKSNSRHEAVFENINRRIKEEIGKARTSIFAAVAWFNEMGLIEELERAAQRGCSVRVIISASEFNYTERFNRLIEAGGELYRYGSEDVFGSDFMHNKFCVIDCQRVITGSFNYTRNASSNAENIVVINDDAVAYQYVEKCLDLIRGGIKENFGEENDISLTFVATSTLVENGSSVKIVWKAENATEISSHVLGQKLPFTGEHSVLVTEDQTIKLMASNPYQEKVAVIHLRVVRNPRISSFEVSEQVIIRSQKTKLRWKVQDSTRVNLAINDRIEEVGEQGEMEVAPTKDTEYVLTAIGDKKEERKVVRVIVYPLPTFKAIPVPVPTKISLETDINIFKNKIFTALSFEHTQAPVVHRVPKVDRMFLNELKIRPKVQDIAKAYGKKMHEMQLPANEKETPFKGLKLSILKKLELLFQNDPKALKIISQIKENYGIEKY